MRLDDSYLKVSDSRWQKAQKWELAFWQEQHRGLARGLKTVARSVLPGIEIVCDDWNLWWAEHFDHYRILPERLDNAVELGCGPYTNMRLVLEERQVRHACCSDPLAKHYVALRRGWLAQAYKAAIILLDDHTIEETPFASDYFDLVLLINVLDHVRDALLCLRQAIRITGIGGYLLIGQDLSNEEDARRTVGDVGHPIRIDHLTIDGELVGFEKKIYRILAREDGRNPAAHYGTYIFAGMKTVRDGS